MRNIGVLDDLKLTTLGKRIVNRLYKQLPVNNKNLAPKLTYLRKLYAPWQLTQMSLIFIILTSYTHHKKSEIISMM